MEGHKPKPGDIIKITEGNPFEGQRFVVLECPKERLGGIHSDCLWVENPDTCKIAFLTHGYEIVGQIDKQCVRDVDAFIRKQTYDNLDSVFG